MAKLANLNNGNAPTTMARRFGHLLRHLHYNEMNQRAGKKISSGRAGRRPLISGFPRVLRTGSTNYKGFCARLGPRGKSRSLQGLLESKKKNGSHAFFEIIRLESQHQRVLF